MSDPSRLHRFSGLEDSIGYMARIIFRRFSASVERRTSRFGITTGQLAVLRALWTGDGVAQHQLSDSLELCEATVAISLQRLETMGVVQRTTNPSNRREMLVFLSDRGRRLEEQIGTVPRAVNALALKGFTPSEMDALHGLLLTVHRNLAANEQIVSAPSPQTLESLAIRNATGARRIAQDKASDRKRKQIIVAVPTRESARREAAKGE